MIDETIMSKVIWGTGGLALGALAKGIISGRRKAAPIPLGEPYVEWKVTDYLSQYHVDSLLSQAEYCGMQVYLYQELPDDAKEALDKTGQFSSSTEYLGEKGFFDESYRCVPSALYFRDPVNPDRWRCLYTDMSIETR